MGTAAGTSNLQMSGGNNPRVAKHLNSSLYDTSRAGSQSQQEMVDQTSSLDVSNLNLESFRFSGSKRQPSKQ